MQISDTKIQVDYVFIVHVPSYREQYGMNATRYEFAQYQPTSLIYMFIYIIWECMLTDLQPFWRKLCPFGSKNGINVSLSIS